jgi:16S rRNA processing protein RimM
MEPAALLAAGIVGRPHGLDGGFHVARPDAELLSTAIPVVIAGVERRVTRRGGTDERPLLRLEGIDTREAVDALRGEAILVAREHAAPLEDDEYWAEDLVGLRVTDGDREVGIVERVRSLPSCEVLEVGDLLVPLVGDAVRAIDLEGGRIDVDLAFLDAG